MIKDVADPEGISIGKIRCDGGGEFRGRFPALAESLGIPIETNAPYIPQGNSIAERGFGTIIGVTCSLLLGAPHLPEKLWAEALKAAVYIRNRTPTDVLGGVETEETQQESAEKPMEPHVQQTPLRKSNKQRGISPDSV